MTARRIDGKQIAALERQQVHEAAESFRQQLGRPPCLAAVLVGDDPASQVYVRNKERACERSGLTSCVHRLPAETSQDALLERIARLNSDDQVDGILVQLPLPGHLNAPRLLDAVCPEKDVDGFHPENAGLMLQGRPRFLPCTPHGVMKILEHEKVTTAGARAVVIGRSEIVGKPMAALLIQRGADATVTVCHSRTRDIASVTREADILIAAAGQPEFVTGDMVQPGAVVIDVGINRVDGRLVGDVHFESVSAVASAVTPVPGGVGPMTIAMLLHNTLTAAQLRYSRST